MQNFDFTNDIVLEDDRALLRPLALNDFENFVHFTHTEPEIWKYSLMSGRTEEELKKYLEFALNARAEEKEYAFNVYDKQSAAYAGSTRFYDIQLSNKCLQLGFTWYGKQFQGSGLNKHCKFLLLQFAFEHMGMERVEFRADNDNAKSIAAMKSIGCKEEGVLRSNGFKPDGRRRDSIVLSILKEEWHTSVKENLQKRINV